MAHTPGPWFVGKPLEQAAAVHFAVYASEDYAVSLTGIVGADDADESVANARLIAAAPDLLAALRGALEYMEANSRSHPSAPVPGTYTGDLILASRVAIAKATIPQRYPGMVEMGNEVYTSPIKPRK